MSTTTFSFPLYFGTLFSLITPPFISSMSDMSSIAFRFLSYVDLKGVTYSSATIATGFGAHLAQPLLRSHVEGREDQLTEQEAIAIMEMCMKVLFYRDARSLNKVRSSLLFLVYNGD